MSSNAQLVQHVLGAVRSGDHEVVRRLVADDFVWTLPGSGRIAGDAQGPQGLIDRLRTVVDAGVRPEVLGILEGEGRVALLQRNTAAGTERSLDVRVVNLFEVRDGRLVRQETYFSDQEQADRFWAPL